MLHSKHKLSIDDNLVLERTLEDILFSCGFNFKDVKPLNYPSDSPQTKSLFERVFVRENLNCEMPMEVTYYSSECYEDMCTLRMQQGSYLYHWSLSDMQLLLRRRKAKDFEEKETIASTKGKKTKS